MDQLNSEQNDKQSISKLKAEYLYISNNNSNFNQGL